MKGMAKSTKHVLLLSAIPIVYPSLGVLETMLKAFDQTSQRTTNLLFKTGALCPVAFSALLRSRLADAHDRDSKFSIAYLTTRGR